MEANEEEILAKIRTLLALERNYLAEERTALAEFRTGLTLALVGPSASAVIVYVNPREGIVLFLTFLISLTVIGIWTCLNSRSRLKEIRKKKKILKDRQAMIIKTSKETYDLLGDFIGHEDE